MSWKTVKLEKICKMNSGGTPSRGIKEYYSGDIPWAKISDIEAADGGIVYSTEEHITKDGLNAINNRIFKKGTLLLAMYGSVGKVAFTGVDMSTNQAILGIRIIDETVLDYSYLKYWFQTIKSKLLDRAVGGTLQNISLGIVKDLEIPLPPLATQKRIAEILDAADALRRKDQELLKKYDELAQAIFIDMFGDPVKNEKGWEEVFLKDVCLKITDGTHQSPKFTNEGVPFLFVSNIVKNKISYETSTFISKEEFDVLNKRTPIEVGNILITTVGSYGNPAVIETNSSFAFQRHIAFLKPNHRLINYYYLFGFLKSPATKNQIDRKVNGVAQKTLNLSDLKDLKIWTPPRSLQDKYSEILNKLQLQFNLSETNRSKILFNSLIQKAFKGELV